MSAIFSVSSYSWMSAYYSSDYYVRKEIYNTGPILAVFWVYPDFMLYKSGKLVTLILFEPLSIAHQN